MFKVERLYKTMQEIKHIQIIIPCYNEQECIVPIYNRINEVTKDLSNYRVTLLYVDDGSKDKTLENIKALENICNNNEVHHISFSRNFGKEAGIYAGLKRSVGDYVVLMDADLQHPPELLIPMIEQIEHGYECCGARRITRTGESVVRSFFSRLFYKFMNGITSMAIEQGTTDYRLMSRKFVNAVLSLSERNRFTKGIFSWVGFETKWIEYKNVERSIGTTKWSMKGLLKYAVNGIVAFTTAPLRYAIYIGMTVILFSILYACVVIIQAFKHPEQRTGYSSILAAVLLMGGLIVLLLGIIGEYLAKIYIEVKKRPVYIEKEVYLEEEKDNNLFN